MGAMLDQMIVAYLDTPDEFRELPDIEIEVKRLVPISRPSIWKKICCFCAKGYDYCDCPDHLKVQAQEIKDKSDGAVSVHVAVDHNQDIRLDVDKEAEPPKQITEAGAVMATAYALFSPKGLENAEVEAKAAKPRPPKRSPKGTGPPAFHDIPSCIDPTFGGKKK